MKREYLVLDKSAMLEFGRLYPADPSWGRDYPTNGICRDTAPIHGAFCTLHQHHSGPHIAHLGDGRAFGTWFDESIGEQGEAMAMYVRLLGGKEAGRV